MSDKALRIFRGPDHDCGYLPNRMATSHFIDPTAVLDAELYGQLLAQGFRRSGGHVYRPNCEGCSACVPARVPVQRFQANRQQRRCLKRNADLDMQIVSQLSDEHRRLYVVYQQQRHAGGSMETDRAEEINGFLNGHWPGTEFWEFRLERRLIAVAVTDAVPGALSAFYTFFDPELAPRSLGRYCILRQIDEAARRGLRQLYLGFWIADCQKMAYKSDYRPLQGFLQNQWQELEPA